MLSAARNRRFIAVLALIAAAGLTLFSQRGSTAKSAFETHLEIGKEYLVRGSYENAVRELSQALKLSPGSSRALIERGTAYNQLKEYDRAIADLTGAIKADSKSSLAFNNRGVSYFRSGRPALALKDFNRAIELTPLDPYANLNYAGAALCAGEEKLGAVRLESWLDRVSWKDRYTGHAAVLAILNRRQAGQKREASDLLARSLKRVNRLEWPYPFLLYLNGKKKADQMLESAKDSDYETTQARCFLALAQNSGGAADKARENFDWVRRYGDKTSLEYWLARSLEKH
ncbi:MAG: tetratricopeptide repeat protein [Candidatus Obscuribacterales bacterium]